MKMNNSANQLILEPCKNGVAVDSWHHGSGNERNPVLFTNMAELQDYIDGHFNADSDIEIVEAEKL